MKIKSAFLLGPMMLLASSVFAQLPAASSMGPTLAPPAMTEKEVITELKKDGPAQLQKDLEKRGVAFEMDADIEKRLRKAKATDEVIKAVTAAGPKERENAAKAAAVASGAVVMSPEETADFKPLQTELDPDKAIALAEGFVQKHPQSVLDSYAYAFEANAYEMKGDAPKIVEYAEKSLQLKKDNLMSLLIITYALPQPQYIGQHQADEETELKKAENYCQQALQQIDELKPQASESAADFARRKASYIAGIHEDLGMVHLDRAQEGLMGFDKDELAKAEGEFKIAVSNNDHPDPIAYYRMGEAYMQDNKLDDALAAFTKASEVGQGPVKQSADQRIETIKKAKAHPAAAAKP